MKETRKPNKQIKEKLDDRNETPQSEESVFTSADVVHPYFRGHSKRLNMKTAPTHEQIAERAYGLWQKEGSRSNQEEDCRLKAEVELTREVS